MLRARSIVALVVAVFAAGCAVTPPLPPADWNQVKLQRQALTHWEMQGRAAVATPKDGWSAGLTWIQSESVSELQLQGALGIGGVHVQSDGHRFEIETSKGEKIEGQDAAAALEQAIGVALPIGKLRFWLLGVPAPDTPATEELDPAGHLSRLEQDGWSASYDRYARYGKEWLPGRLQLKQGDVRLRVVVDRWQLPQS